MAHSYSIPCRSHVKSWFTTNFPKQARKDSIVGSIVRIMQMTKSGRNIEGGYRCPAGHAKVEIELPDRVEIDQEVLFHAGFYLESEFKRDVCSYIDGARRFNPNASIIEAIKAFYKDNKIDEEDYDREATKSIFRYYTTTRQGKKWGQPS